MGRVLVVSHNPGMAMGLASTDHDVVDMRPAALDLWVNDTSVQPVDGVVLDVSEPEAALSAITELRAHARMAPVLVVPGEGPRWDDPRLRELPAAAMLPRPVSKPSLQAAVDRLLSHGADSFLVSSVPPAGILGARAGDGTMGATAEDAEREREIEAELDDAAPDAESTGPTDADVAGLLERLTAPSTLAVTAATAPSLDPIPLAPPPVSAPVPITTRPTITEGSTTGVHSPRALVDALLAVRHELYGVAETAEVVVHDALERVDAEAAALLVPDGSRWRVAAGVGLRPLEHRYELTADDWLVVQIAGGGRAVVMEDTDIVRQPLRGSPLASWHHLVAVPVPLISGALLLARSEGAASFAEEDVATLSELTIEAAPWLESSLEVRTLARTLSPLRDDSDGFGARG